MDLSALTVVAPDPKLLPVPADPGVGRSGGPEVDRPEAADPDPSGWVWPAAASWSELPEVERLWKGLVDIVWPAVVQTADGTGLMLRLL